MDSIEQTYSKEAILRALDRLHQDAITLYGSLSPQQLFSHPAEGWSLADNLDHLIKASQPVLLALRLPKLILRLRFGRSAQPSRSFIDIRDAYVRKLEQGAQASGPYLPNVAAAPAAPAAAQRQLLERWATLGHALGTQIDRWSEGDLDRYVLPHPLLGKLTVREVLFFTLYHNWRHISAGQD